MFNIKSARFFQGSAENLMAQVKNFCVFDTKHLMKNEFVLKLFIKSIENIYRTSRQPSQLSAGGPPTPPTVCPYRSCSKITIQNKEVMKDNSQLRVESHRW